MRSHRYLWRNKTAGKLPAVGFFRAGASWVASASWVAGAIAISTWLGCGGGETPSQPEPPDNIAQVPDSPAKDKPAAKSAPAKDPLPSDPPKTKPKPKVDLPSLPGTNLPPLPAEWKLNHQIQLQWAPSGLAFSSDRLRLAACGEGSVTTWATTDWQPAPIEVPEGMVSAIAFSPDGKSLAYALNLQSAMSSSARLVELESAKQTVVYESTSGQLSALAFHPRRPYLALGGSNFVIEFHNYSKSEKPLILRGHRGFITSLSFSADGNSLASGSSDKTVRIWNLTRSAKPRVLSGEDQWVSAAVFSPDGKWIAQVGGGLTTRLWTVGGRTEANIFGHAKTVTSVAFSPDSRLLATGSADNTVRLHEVPSGKVVTVLKQHTDYVTTLAFSPDGKILATAGNDRRILLWNVPVSKQE